MVRYVPPPLLIVMGVVGLSLLLATLTMIFTVALVIGMIVLPLLITRGVVRTIAREQRRRGYLAGGHRPALHGRPAVDPWQAAKSKFATLRAEYAAYECDPLAVLRLPALADVNVPSTARFIEAFAEAQALDVEGPAPPAHRAQFVAAVQRAWQAWQAAREAAERIRLSNLPAEEHATVDRVVRLLVTARDTDNDAERYVAYTKARSELARLERTTGLRLPRPAQARLEAAARGQLPA
jgi:hypothetical protein